MQAVVKKASQKVTNEDSVINTKKCVDVFKVKNIRVVSL